MKKTKWMAVALMTTLSLSFLGGCGQDEENEQKNETQATQEQVSPKNLNAWEGEWNSLEDYLSQPDLKKIFAKVAKVEGKSEEEYVSTYQKDHHADFRALAIKGNTISFFDGKIGEGKKIAEGTYEYAKDVKANGSGESWTEFKAKGESAYPVLLFLPVEKEGLVHFHMKYGKTEQEALAMQEWSPAFIKPDSTVEQIAGEIEE